MRFLNPFSRSTNKRATTKRRPATTAARGGSKRKVKKTTRRRNRAGINWRLVMRAVPVCAALGAVGGLAWLWQDGWFGRQAEALRLAALQGSADMGLKVEEVLVEGRHRTDGELILARLGLALGRPILDVDPEAARAELEALPWVQVATVQRRFPDRVTVLVTEQVPVLRWGENALLNPYGEIFRPKDIGMFAALPRLSGPSGSEQMMLARFDQLMETFAPRGLGIRELDLDGKYSWSVVLDNGIRVVLGRHELVQRSSRLAALLDQPQALAAAAGGTVDLRYSNGFAVSASAPVAQSAQHIKSQKESG